MTWQITIPFRTDWKSKRLVALLAFGLVLTLAGCASITAGGSGAAGTNATPSPGAGTPGTQGTLAGDVVAGPTCPVERAEDPCPPKAVPNREVQILGANNAIVATTMTDSKGHFSVTVAPGTYTVILPIKQGQIGMRQISDVKVSVVAGQIATVKIMLDTGIR